MFNRPNNTYSFYDLAAPVLASVSVSIAAEVARPTAIVLLAVLPSIASHSTFARDHLYGAIDNQSLLQCETLNWAGQLLEAAACYSGLHNREQTSQIRAEAFWAQGDLQNANTQFQDAIKRFPEDPMVRVRWGELFIDSYQYSEAYTLFGEALEIDPENSWAHIGAASALSEGGDPEVLNQHLNKVMEEGLAPHGAKLRAMMMVIRSLLRQDRYQEAERSLEEAFEFAEDESLATMELKALRASYEFMTRGDYQVWIDASLEESPGYGDAWFIPGYHATIIRRYEEAGDFFKEAVTLQPDHWEAHIYLGQNYLRLNDINDAIRHVNISYDGNAFNPMTVNLLRLLDTFTEDFVSITYPDPPEGPLPELVVKLHKEERDVLKNYARKLSEDSIDVYTERYRFEPKEPIIVEIYPNHEDFVVRSIGMPGVGILGVTFGYLFAMDSPTGHPDQRYHWGTTLWHEMAHVFTLKATGNLVPRWFSEGISVYEEWRTGPIPGRKIPTNVLQAMAEDKFLPIAVLDDGFMRPNYDGQVIVSYMQAGLIFDFIDLEYGFDKIVDMLYLFNEDITPVAAIEQVLGISDSEFDRHFKQFIDIEYGPLLNGLGVWMEDMRAGYEALQAEKWEEAAAAAERAVFTYPDYVENDSPYIVMARAYEKLDNKEEEFQALQTFWQKGGYLPAALLSLADYYLERKMNSEAEAVLMDTSYADPFIEDLHVKLGDLYMDTQRPAKALEEFEVLLALDPLDKASANYRIANAYNALDNDEKTMEYLMTALDIAPQFRPAQQLLLEMSRTSN
ncbi:MAG: tetratricopeptide repeat protein [Gammaproteobacteria bacterium]|nr:tetratricopeptide repeat protein [Gammaproteobacteria bacterium]MBT6043830.1 tetratricopeptide repeat protein [Gammaproteobacteria bacterium]